jgi:hypothetical protein
MEYGVYRIDKILTDALKGAGFKRVTFGDVSEKDLQKQTIFPFAHLTLLTNQQTRSIETFTYEIAILDIVDVNSNDPRESKNELSLTSNVEDVFHDLGFKWNKAWQTVVTTANNQIQLPESITLNAGYAEVQNKLAGYTINLSITIPNSGVC